MAFMFSLEKAKSLLEDPLSCFKCVTMTKRITLPHYFVGDHRQGAKEFLNLGLKRFSETLDGILITYYDTMILSRNGCIMDDLPYFTFNVKANFILFRPHVGSVLKGIVNKLSPDHIGCLVHDHFNASIFKNSEEEWDTPRVQVGCVVTFEVTSLDLCSKIIFIRGKLLSVEDPDPAFLLENHNEDISKANIVFSSPGGLRKINFDSDTDEGSGADVKDVVQLDVAKGSGEEKKKKGSGKDPAEKKKKKLTKDKTNGKDEEVKKEKGKTRKDKTKGGEDGAKEKDKTKDKTKGKVKTKGNEKDAEEKDNTAGMGIVKAKEDTGENFEDTSKEKENAQKPKSPQKKGKVTYDISDSEDDGEEDAMKGKKHAEVKRGSPKKKEPECSSDSKLGVEDESKGKERAGEEEKSTDIKMTSPQKKGKAAVNSLGKKVGSPLAAKRKMGSPKGKIEKKDPGGGLDLSTFEEAEISRIFQMAEIEVGSKRKSSGSEEAEEAKRKRPRKEKKAGEKEKTEKKDDGEKKTKEEKKRERELKKKEREEKKKVREVRKKEKEEKRRKRKEDKEKKMKKKNRKTNDGKDKDEKRKKKKKDNKGKKES